jgi:DinB superfamily
MQLSGESRGSTGLLLRQYDEAFNRKSWHGPNLRGSLRGVTEEEAAWRVSPPRHNIWEITIHAAYWKYAVRRRLTGEKRGTFILAGSNWFTCPGHSVPVRWNDAVRLLENEHRLLRKVIAGLRDSDLRRTVRGSRTTTLAMVAGIIAHDLYHAGQIQLLKRLVRG